MTTITAKVNPDRASVTVTLSPDEVVSSVMRHDANGIQPVRFPAGTFPTSRSVQVDDWEAALAGPVVYRSGTGSTQVILGGDSPWLTPPLTPSASVRLSSVLDYDGSRQSASTVSTLAGGGAVVKLGAMGPRTGTFTILCADHGVAAHLEDLLARYPQQLLRVPDHADLDLYFLCTGTKISPADKESGLWAVAVEYTQTQAPVAALPTWTYRSLASAYSTLAAASSAYSSLAGLAVNDGTL